MVGHPEEYGIGRVAMNETDIQRYFVFRKRTGNIHNAIRTSVITSSDRILQQWANIVEYHRTRCRRSSHWQGFLLQFLFRNTTFIIGG